MIKFIKSFFKKPSVEVQPEAPYKVEAPADPIVKLGPEPTSEVKESTPVPTITASAVVEYVPSTESKPAKKPRAPANPKAEKAPKVAKAPAVKKPRAPRKPKAE